MKRSRYVLSPVLIALLGYSAHAQCVPASSSSIPPPEVAPHLWLHLQDTKYVCRIVEGDTLRDDFAAVYWAFGSDNDSSRTRYMFTELRRNGQRLRISDWSDMRVIDNLDDAALSQLNRSDAITLNAGDVISFYRELTWISRATDLWTVDNYYSPDSISYAVELVNATTGKRLALMDTIGVMPRVTSGIPLIHGWRPFMANAEYTVPPALAGQSAFVRVQHYLRGPGQYNTARFETYGAGFRQKLDHPYWQQVLHTYGDVIYAKRTIEDVHSENGTLSSLMVSPNPSSGDVSINFSAPESGGPVSVVVYNSNGEQSSLPMGTLDQQSSGTLTHAFPSNGVYVIALLQQGKITASQTITITK